MGVKITNYHCDGCNNGIVVMQKHEDNNKGSVKLTSNPCNGCKKDFKLSEASKLSKVSFASSTAEATALKERVLELEGALSNSKFLLGRLRRSISVHPDNELGSEFDDLTTDAQNFEDEIEVLIIKDKEEDSNV